MRFLVDECVFAALVGWLRAKGHDVSYAAEGLVGETDGAVLRRANDESRIIVTSDKDFGDLVVLGRRFSEGVLLLRLESATIEERMARIESVWLGVERHLPGHFVVVSESRVRVRPLVR